MKNLIAKLKELNYKQLAIDHGEKGLLGLVGLFVLISLAGTSWSRYDKMPEEFLKKIKEGEDNIKASDFSAERQKEFRSARDIHLAVQQLHSPLEEPGRFDYQTNWVWPMYPQQERVKEPRLLAALESVATFGRFIMQELPPETQNEMLVKGDESPDGAAPSKAADSDDDNKPRRPSSGELDPRAVGRGSASKTPLAGSAKGSAYEATPMGGGAGTRMGTNQGINARGQRFVAVRSLFPLKDQIDEFVKAMHESTNKAAELVEFQDFELQRQVAVAGNDPWSGKWEGVDINVAMEVLDRVDFDTELVDQAWTDAVFTMPLPRRIAGTWERFASHPKIKQLKLEQAQAQEQISKRLIEEAETKKLEEKGKKGGFTAKQHDVRGIRNQMGFGGGGTSSIMAEMAKGIGAAESANAGRGGNDAMTNFGNQMQSTNARVTKYLLFRYFDFDVAPGNAYRYRVRFVLRNPNFKRPVEELVDAAYAEGEQRTTPWSEPTTPVVVPEEQKVFLAKADRARPEAGTVLPSAKFDIFQWFSDAGTNILAKTDSLQLGQFVGGRLKTQVLRPAADSFHEEDVSVFTGSVLTDIVAAPFPELDPVEHADLKVDVKKLKNLGTVDKALLVDRYGQLVTLDPKSTTDELKQSERSIKDQSELWKHLKDKEQPQGGGSALDKMAQRLRGASGSGSTDATAAGAGYGATMGAMNPTKKSPPGSSGGKASAKGKGVKPVRGGGSGGAAY